MADSSSMLPTVFAAVSTLLFSISLWSSLSEKRTQITYKIAIGSSNGNLMPFRVFRILFPISTMEELNTTINKSIVFRTYN